MAKYFDPIEVFFWVLFLICGLVGVGVEYFAKGHLTKDTGQWFLVYMGSVTASQVLAKFHEKQNAIQDGIEKLKSQMEAMKEQIQGLEKSLDNIERAAR